MVMVGKIGFMIRVFLICLVPFSGICQKKYDTIWVGNPSRTVKIAFDIGLPTSPVVDIGTKDYAAKVLGCCDVILKSIVVNAGPTSLYIRYGDKYYSGTIAYKENLSVDDEVLDFRNSVSLPEPINETRAITSESPSLEKQMIARRMGILEGRTKDRISTIAAIKEKLTFKLADIVQDENFLYFKFRFYNDSKTEYKIELIDFLYRNSKDEREYSQGLALDNNGVTKVPIRSDNVLIFVLPKFTITAKWELIVTIREKEGTRKLELTIPGDKINEAVSL